VPADSASPYADLVRPPLSAARLLRDLAPDGVWGAVQVLEEATSTNAVVADCARRGEPEGLVVIAEAQSAGRGRLGRAWVSPPRAGLTLSVLLRPAPAVERWPLIGLLAGVALCDAVTRLTGLEVALKWPNDLLAPAGGKLAGLLAERVGDAVVLGIGINVSTRRPELPDPRATSLHLEGALTDREPMLKALLRCLGPAYDAWQAAGGGPDLVIPAYRRRCRTLGTPVQVRTADGRSVTGTALDVDDDGRLVVDSAGTRSVWSAGDVVQLRPGEGSDGLPAAAAR